MQGPAYRVETERLVLRCYELSDHAAVSAVIGADVERLRMWMPWVKDEPLSEEARIAKLRKFRSGFDRGEDFVCGIFDRDGVARDGAGRTIAQRG